MVLLLYTRTGAALPVFSPSSWLSPPIGGYGADSGAPGAGTSGASTGGDVEGGGYGMAEGAVDSLPGARGGAGSVGPVFGSCCLQVTATIPIRTATIASPTSASPAVFLRYSCACLIRSHTVLPWHYRGAKAGRRPALARRRPGLSRCNGSNSRESAMNSSGAFIRSYPAPLGTTAVRFFQRIEADTCFRRPAACPRHVPS
jgi:hypothetical protein